MNIFGFEYFKNQVKYCIICHESIHTMMYDICPVCGWEDEGEWDLDGYGEANRISENMYRQKFQDLRKKDPNWSVYNNGYFEITEEDMEEADRIWKKKCEENGWEY